MDAPENSLFISFKDNPELAKEFTDKKVGEKCLASVLFQVNTKDENGIAASVEEVKRLPYSEGKAPEEADGAGDSGEEEMSPADAINE